ncbi:MAG: chemotaxis protein CheX [Helicobacteraceae bacterium]|nr:chemotaxis protein CheX [Candidatus Sulfurimonas ponti]MBL6973304.1 chemotaxis protein CheX [Sulfurimonas sp.]
MINIKNEIITFSYNGVIQDNKNMMLLNLIEKKISTGAKFKGILISVAGLIYDNSTDVSSLVKQLTLFSKKLNIEIGLTDYSIPLYTLLKSLTKNTKLNLFKNYNSARLFLDAKLFKEGMRVLVYDEDTENSKELSKKLSLYGYAVVLAKDFNHLKELSQEKHYDIVITNSTLNNGVSNAGVQKSALSLSKNLISNLPLFMDTAVETLISFTGLEAKKSAHSIRNFDTNLSTETICSVMRFHEALEGSFILIFPKDIAIIAIESLLGETVAEDDMDTIMDGVSEFCNIITGSIKTALSMQNIKVLFDLPKTFPSLESTLKDIGDNNGIWIDMQLDGKPFFMFITK